jgi:hypothetical protein
MGEPFPQTPLFVSDRLKIKKIGIITDLSERLFGAGGRNRTDMELPPEDFESEINDTGCVEKSPILLGFLRKYAVFARSDMLAGDALIWTFLWSGGHDFGHTGRIQSIARIMG